MGKEYQPLQFIFESRVRQYAKHMLSFNQEFITRIKSSLLGSREMIYFLRSLPYLT